MSDATAPITVNAQGDQGPRPYQFPQALVARFPLLLAPETRFLALDSVYELLLTGDLSLVPKGILTDDGSRRRFLDTCARVGYTLDPPQLRYLAEVSGLKTSLKTVRTIIRGWRRSVLEQIRSDRRTEKWTVKFQNRALRLQFPSALAAGLTVVGLLQDIADKRHDELFEQNLRYPGLVEQLASTFIRKTADRGTFQKHPPPFDSVTVGESSI